LISITLQFSILVIQTLTQVTLLLAEASYLPHLTDKFTSKLPQEGSVMAVSLLIF
jgi:hypothetical protein